MAESSPPKPNDFPQLPNFAEKLPELSAALMEAAEELTHLPETDSFLPCWEDAYKVTHSLKGLSNLLPGPAAPAEACVVLSDVVAEGYLGSGRIMDHQAAAKIFRMLSEEFSASEPSLALIEKLSALYQEGPTHEQRQQQLKLPLPRLQSAVTKKSDGGQTPGAEKLDSRGGDQIGPFSELARSGAVLLFA